MRDLKGATILFAAEYIAVGGTRTYACQLLDFYRRHGATGVMVTSFEGGDPEMKSFAEDCGFEVVRFRDLSGKPHSRKRELRPALWSPRAVSREVELFDRFRERHDLDFVTVSTGTAGLFLSAAATSPRPLIIEHGYPHGLRQRFLGGTVMAPLVPHDAVIVAMSDYARGRFSDAWSPSRHGFQVTALRSTCGPVQEPTDDANRESLVLTAALVEEHKRPGDWLGVAAAVAACESASPKPQFQWLGDGPLLQRMRQQARKSGLQNVSFPGWSVNTADHYRRARVYLQMSSKEALGLSVIDALRFGVPAVVTDAGGLPEVVMDGVNGFVIPVGDVDAAAAATRELLVNDSLWTKQSAAARDIYQQRFEPDRWDEALLALHVGQLE